MESGGKGKLARSPETTFPHPTAATSQHEVESGCVVVSMLVSVVVFIVLLFPLLIFFLLEIWECGAGGNDTPSGGQRAGN